MATATYPRLPPPAELTLRRGLTRDHAVDLIKGWACLLMIFAHVPLPGAGWLKFDTMGAVLFFSSTGMNFWGLIERRRGDEARIAANAMFLIFAGFADNYVQGTLWMADVFQSAGMAMLAMLAFNRIWPRWWTWLFPLPFAIHFLNAHVYYWKVTDHGVLGSFFLAPGLFPLLPWLTFYMLGAHLKRYPGVRMRLGIGVAALAACGILVSRQGFLLNKFWMSPDYWLLGLAYTALLLDGLRRWLGARARAGRKSVPWAELRYWGANSLVFYILQNFVIRLLQLWFPSGWSLFLATLLITALLMRPILGLQRWVQGRNPGWILAACVVFSAGVLGLETWVLTGGASRTFFSFGLTLAFVAAYPAFKLLSRRLPRHREAAA